jgi:hypothetical protein
MVFDGLVKTIAICTEEVPSFPHLIPLSQASADADITTDAHPGNLLVNLPSDRSPRDAILVETLLYYSISIRSLRRFNMRFGGP